MRYPKPLTPGSTLAITAFSSGISHALLPRFETVCAHLKQQGYQLEIGQCLLGEYQGASACATERASELMGYLMSDKVDAIYPPWGGELAMEILPLLDFEALAAAKPKWIMGFSDVSTLAVAITSKLGWASAHTPNLMDLVPLACDSLTEHTLTHMATETGQSFTQHPSQYYASQWPDFTADPEAILSLDSNTHWQWLSPPQHGYCVSGRLIGGCWDTLIDLFNTEFLPLGALKQRYPEGILLYLENAEMSPQALTRAILSMQFKGVFEHINGLLLGRSFAAESDTLTYTMVLEKHLKQVGIPVAIGLDIGHAPPNLTLINGSLADLTIAQQHTLIQRLV